MTTRKARSGPARSLTELAGCIQLAGMRAGIARGAPSARGYTLSEFSTWIEQTFEGNELPTPCPKVTDLWHHRDAWRAFRVSLPDVDAKTGRVTHAVVLPNRLIMVSQKVWDLLYG